jgi:hypothetical protein
VKKADFELAEVEAAPRLNERLYTAEPHVYFGHRLFFLMLAADRSVDLAQFVRRGLEVNQVKLGPSAEAAEDAASREQRYRFVLAETLLLLHHVGETLLRLYFAHEGTPPTPWLVLARERSPEKFKAKVRHRFVTTERLGQADQEALTAVFHGSSDLSWFDPPPPVDRLAAGIKNIDQWLRYFAREFLDYAPLYNALKHGLAIQPGNAELEFSVDNVELPFLTMVGPTILYLEQREHENRKVWSESTRWFSFEETLLACQFGIKMIEALWDVARVRYVGARVERVWILDQPAYGDFAKMPRKGDRGTLKANLPYYTSGDDVGDDGA